MAVRQIQRFHAPAQSVKNADTAEEKGYDGGKPSRYILPKLCQTSVCQSLRQFAKISGIKRHIAVDTNGFPHAIRVTTANISDKAGAVEMFEESRDRASLPRVENILLDGGYTGQPFADKIREILGCSVEVVKRSDEHEFKVIPKRWVVERCFAWLEKARRLFKNVERKISTSKQMVVLAFLALLIKR